MAVGDRTPPGGGFGVPRFAAAGDPVLAPDVAPHRMRRVLGELVLADAGQRELRSRMLAFADAHPDAFARTCAEGHFTGSAVVLDAAGARVAMLFHRKLRRWLQPGGHADGDTNLAGVALREATEETGIAGLVVWPIPIDLDIHRVEPPGEPAHDHLDVRFLVVAPPAAAFVGNHESTDRGWFSDAELAGLGLDVGTHRMIGAARRVRVLHPG